MADLFNAFKSALAQAGPGLVAQMQGKDEIATQMYRAGASQAELVKRQKDRQFDNNMRAREMSLKLQQAKESSVLKAEKARKEDILFNLKLKNAMEGKGDPVKLQQVRDTYNAETNNPVNFDPTKRDNSLVDSITGQPVKKVYTGVQNRFNIKDSRSVEKDLAKEAIRQQPVKTVLNSLDAAEKLLEKGENLVNSSEGLFGIKMGFTGSARNKLQSVLRSSDMFDVDQIDATFEQFNGLTTQVIAQQVRSFTGAQATDAERQFLMQMTPSPSVSPAINRVRIANLRKMMQFIDKRNAAIEARLGRPIKNISEHLLPEHSLMQFVSDNQLTTEGTGETTSIDQQQKLDQINRNIIEINNIKKQLQGLE